MLQLIQPGRRARALALSAVAAGPFMLAGCGGDDDGGGSGRTASDEEYVASMCESFNTFATDFFSEVMAAALSGGGSEEETNEAVTEAAKEVFQPLIDDLKSMGVPEDVREYHDQMTEQMEDALNAIEDGGIEALDDESAFGEDIEFPAEIEERLQAVAEDTEECADLDLFASGT